MRIQASVGRAPASVSLKEQVYKLTLTAQTDGEKQWLAGLLPAVQDAACDARRAAAPPKLRVISGDPTP